MPKSFVLQLIRESIVSEMILRDNRWSVWPFRLYYINASGYYMFQLVELERLAYWYADLDGETHLPNPTTELWHLFRRSLPQCYYVPCYGLCPGDQMIFRIAFDELDPVWHDLGKSWIENWIRTFQLGNCCNCFVNLSGWMFGSLFCFLLHRKDILAIGWLTKLKAHILGVEMP